MLHQHQDFAPRQGVGQSLALKGIERFTAVWFRRVKKPVLALAEAHVAEYVAGELRPCCKPCTCCWTASGLASQLTSTQVENKLYQLKRAEELGFTVPETLVTNEKSALRDFFHRHQCEVLLKPLYNTRVAQGEEQRILFTNKLKPEHVAQLDCLLTPSICQRNIPKAYGARVTVVGQEVFAAAVDSQAMAAIRQGWRRDRLPFRAYERPTTIAGKCVALVQTLQLRFGAIDLIKSTDGQCYFLEINPNGQWAWVELDCGLPISRALIAEFTTWCAQHGCFLHPTGPAAICS
ncbi:hypothetical protein [Hymenobacter coccineus]|uniref:ATP-grasp domain-containing protein n=1 Tax=Hymenobacter coccineus TaxID=1908235 RepID=A0A1G1TH01_9BACT|nr:hypothetical protein [Hymenobacter coccineus]OGX90160.1 hypothetical protein BEN49_07330 [Hymenobacter coccineus]